MRMYDLIRKKRDGERLAKEEIDWMIRSYTNGKIPDYQMSALMMAIYFRGMNEQETLNLTLAMADSGERLDLSAIPGIKVDKHSTGGVGDKTSLALVPLVASCGIPVAKMSGRGLGHTGGTIDKLESFSGFSTAIPVETFIKNVNTIGISIMGQTADLAPADKKLYALRDVTATVDSIPLIAVSIMSKKLAAGNDGILLDVKTGSRAFRKTVEESIALAKEMVAIGENAGKKMAALITNMDIPLGHNIGNSLEVIEAVETLKGKGPADLTEVCLQLASNMLYLAGKGTEAECRVLAENAVKSGAALERLVAMVEAQGGDSEVILNPDKFEKAPYVYEVKAEKDGYITHIDAEGCGIASAMLGAGRETKESEIDYTAGIILHKKTGEKVNKGDVLAALYTSKEELFEAAAEKYKKSIFIEQEAPKKEPLVYARVTPKGIEKY